MVLPKYTFLILLLFALFSPFIISHFTQAQSCDGSWALQRFLNSDCAPGQWVGWQNSGNPAGCPVNPTYVGTQTNTFTFTNPVSGFSMDFRGPDGEPLCPRIEIKINGVFYPLTSANLTDLPFTCTTSSFDYITLTSDGYITESLSGDLAAPDMEESQSMALTLILLLSLQMMVSERHSQHHLIVHL